MGDVACSIDKRSHRRLAPDLRAVDARLAVVVDLEALELLRADIYKLWPRGPVLGRWLA
jgi:hypothetical protein